LKLIYGIIGFWKAQQAAITMGVNFFDTFQKPNWIFKLSAINAKGYTPSNFIEQE